jgi:hypothetical protein
MVLTDRVGGFTRGAPSRHFRDAYRHDFFDSAARGARLPKGSLASRYDGDARDTQLAEAVAGWAGASSEFCSAVTFVADSRAPSRNALDEGFGQFVTSLPGGFRFEPSRGGLRGGDLVLPCGSTGRATAPLVNGRC